MVSKNTRNIFRSFSLSNSEFQALYKKFNYLAKFAAWQLIKKNVRNNHTDELEDIEQDLLIAILRSAVYYKRQVYIESCLDAGLKHVKDKFTSQLVNRLAKLWDSRKKHGANKQRFGESQEKILECIIKNFVPIQFRPDPKKPLIIDSEFATYCKSITWNQQRAMGRKITKERGIRSSMVSLGDYSYLASSNKNFCEWF